VAGLNAFRFLQFEVFARLSPVSSPMTPPSSRCSRPSPVYLPLLVSERTRGSPFRCSQSFGFPRSLYAVPSTFLVRRVTFEPLPHDVYGQCPSFLMTAVSAVPPFSLALSLPRLPFLQTRSSQLASLGGRRVSSGLTPSVFIFFNGFKCPEVLCPLPGRPSFLGQHSRIPCARFIAFFP